MSIVTPPSPLRDKTYHFRFVVFKVEGVLYNVPEYRFINDSMIFRTLFTLPSGGTGDYDGMSDEKPLELSGIEHIDFQRFLDVLYPLETPMVLHRTLESWTSVLKLATMWSFRSIRSFSIENMHSFVDKISPVDRIALAQQYGVSKWFISGFEEMIQRSEGISESEWDALSIVGPSWCHYITSERESCWIERHKRATGFGRGSECSQSHELSLRDMFKQELDDMAREDPGPESRCLSLSGLGGEAMTDGPASPN